MGEHLEFPDKQTHGLLNHLCVCVCAGDVSVGLFMVFVEESK